MYSRRCFVPLVSVLGLAALGSCVNEVQSFQMVFDPCAPLVIEPRGDMTADERASVDDAIAMWQAVVDVELTTASDNAEARRLPVEIVDSDAYWGYFDDVRGVIQIGGHVEPRHPRAIVIAHEFGHAFNMFHDDAGDGPSVMREGNRNTVPTALDATTLADKWGECVTR